MLAWALNKTAKPGASIGENAYTLAVSGAIKLPKACGAAAAIRGEAPFSFFPQVGRPASGAQLATNTAACRLHSTTADARLASDAGGALAMRRRHRGNQQRRQQDMRGGTSTAGAGC